MHDLLGILRSLVLYYGIPGRATRLRRFYSPLVPPGSTCFDIGAHVGNRVRAFRSLGARVIAIEPQASCVEVLRRLYGRDPMVSIVAAAVGDSVGETVLWVTPNNPTLTTASADWVAQSSTAPGFTRVRWQKGETVRVTTLQALIQTHGVPAFVKIDVEGFEAQVLAGLTTPIPCLSFEYLAVAKPLAHACIDRLNALARYEYNWSVGESHRLSLARWCSARDIHDFVDGLAERDGSGDIYARLPPRPSPPLAGSVPA